MPNDTPPGEDLADLLHHTLPSGSLLWRVSRRTFVQRGSLFNARLAPAGSGPGPQDKAIPFGRFDAGQDEPYAYCYAGLDDLTAIAETLLRDVGFASRVRAIPFRDVKGRCVAVYETLRPLSLVGLTTSAELSRARQDPWLIQADPDEYAGTRRWGHWLRRSSKDSHGFVWPSRRNPGGRCVVLFHDRIPLDHVSVVPVLTRDLDGGGGLEWLNRRLEDLNTVVDPDVERGGDAG
jgi:hypothetical protein